MQRVAECVTHALLRSSLFDLDLIWSWSWKVASLQSSEDTKAKILPTEASDF